MTDSFEYPHEIIVPAPVNLFEEAWTDFEQWCLRYQALLAIQNTRSVSELDNGYVVCAAKVALEHVCRAGARLLSLTDSPFVAHYVKQYFPDGFKFPEIKAP